MLNNLFSSVVSLQLTASYVILLVMLLRFLLRKQPKIYSYALWSVVLFRLLCPLRFETVLSLIPRNVPNITNSVTAVPMVSGSTAATVPSVQTPVGSTVELPTVPLSPAQPSTVIEQSFDWMALLPYLWLAGVVFLVLYSLWGLLKLKRSLRSAEQTNGNLYVVQGLETAFVLGIIQPKIYLPAGLSAEEQDYILLHERTHLRRGDHLIKIAAFAALCVHWFNPLVWLAFLLSAQDMEMSCDEAVIARLGSDVKKAYSGSLLSMAAGKRLLRATPLAFGEGDTKVRIKNILNYKKPAFWVSGLLLVLVAAAGVALASDPLSLKSAVTEEEAKAAAEFYYPAPYILEAEKQKNVVGDENTDWLYKVYLDISAATSKTETALERRQVGSIAVDGANRDLWVLQDGKWMLEQEHIDTDYETLWKNRTDYIGDNSRVIAIAANLPYPAGIKYENISIQSSTEPYVLTLNLTADTENDMDKLDLSLTNYWEFLLRSLIGNLGAVEIKITSGAYSKHWGADYHDNSEEYAAAVTLENFRAAGEKILLDREKMDAKVMLLHYNDIENMKRAAFYYMTWPENFLCTKLAWGMYREHYTYKVRITFEEGTAPQIGTAEEQLLRKNAAAMMEPFYSSIIEYQFGTSEELLVYSKYDNIGIRISDEEIAAEAELAAYLQTIMDGEVPVEEVKEEVLLQFPLREEEILAITDVYEAEKHNGLCLYVEHGTELFAVADGIVKEAADYVPGTGDGIYVTVEHSGGFESRYAHCSELLVEVGQSVKAGEVIAKSGSTGNTTGPVLHFELMQNGEYLNPMEYLPIEEKPVTASAYLMLESLLTEHRDSFGRALDHRLEQIRNSVKSYPQDFPPIDLLPEVSPDAPTAGLYFAWSDWLSEKPVAGDVLHTYLPLDEQHAILFGDVSIIINSGFVTVEFADIRFVKLPDDFSSWESYLEYNYEGVVAGTRHE